MLQVDAMYISLVSLGRPTERALLGRDEIQGDELKGRLASVLPPSFCERGNIVSIQFWQLCDTNILFPKVVTLQISIFANFVRLPKRQLFGHTKLSRLGTICVSCSLIGKSVVRLRYCQFGT